jgi:hypothetical protein
MMMSVVKQTTFVLWEVLADCKAKGLKWGNEGYEEAKGSLENGEQCVADACICPRI